MWTEFGAEKESYRYFKFMPIRWRVLDIDTKNNTALIMADKAIDCKCYNIDGSVVTWEDCTLRSWLNGYGSNINNNAIDYSTAGKSFYSVAFSDEEKAAILTSSVRNNKKDLPKGYQTNPGNNTEDKIYILSYKESTDANYGFDKEMGYDANRQLVASDYTSAMGSYLYSNKTTSYIKTTQWWLRSSGKENLSQAMFVNYGGNEDYCRNVGYYASTDSRMAASVVPVMQVKLNGISYDVPQLGKRNIEYVVEYGNNVKENPSTYDIGKGVPSFAAPVRDGYEFEGWFDKYDAKFDSISTTYDSNIILYAKWKYTYVYYGSYPQSEVTEANIIAAIDKELGADKTGDCWIGDVKYRKCQKEDCTDNEQWGNSTYRYFRWERIKWRVLDKDTANGKLVLMSEKGIDTKKYNDEATEITWADCSLRKWLNDENDKTSFFSTAFSGAEQKIIYELLKGNKSQGVASYSEWAGEDTMDKVFLFSFANMIYPKYGFSEGYESDAKRTIGFTDYTEAMGAMRAQGDLYGYWWLRSPGDTPSRAIVMNSTGGLNKVMEVNASITAVVPVVIVDVNSQLYETADDGTSGYGGEDRIGINYVLSGGTNSKANPVWYRKSCGVASFAAPSRKGYTFEGWYSDSKFTQKINSIGKNVGGEVTLYAKWKKIPVENPFETVDVTKDISKKKISIKVNSLVGGNTGGAQIAYALNGNYGKNVTLDSKKGTITIKAKYAGIINVTITSQATADYIETTKAAVITIAPSKVKGLKAKADSKAKCVKLTWKASSFADGYEIKYSQNKDFSNAKTKTVKKSGLSYTITKLKSKQPCYVQVRAYKKVKGGKVYSAIVNATVKKVK